MSDVSFTNGPPETVLDSEPVALRDALITNRAAVPPEVVKRLDLLVGKYYA